MISSEIESLRPRLELTARHLLRYPFPIWHYGDSIGFEGLIAASELLGDKEYFGWVYGALKAWAARRQPFKEIDNTVPGHALCLVIERTGDEQLLTAAQELATFLTSRRTAGGAFVSFERAPLRQPYGGAPATARDADLISNPGPGVFVDCLHFDPPFFAHLGKVTGREDLQRIAVEQALAYVALLQDESGLFWHFWLERTEDRYGLAWGRGQGWALLGLLDLLSFLPENIAGRSVLVDATRRLCSALAQTQALDGSWRSVVTDPRAGPEASTAAFATAGLLRAAALGIVDDSFRDHAVQAWRATRSHIDKNGVLIQVSAALWASTVPSHYPNAPTGFVVPWGQGPVLVAANEVRRAGSA